MYARHLGPAHKTYDAVRGLIASFGAGERERLRQRARIGGMLAALNAPAADRFEGTVLIDGLFDNANYWLRAAMVRAALGTQHGREVGLAGGFSRGDIARMFSALGVDRVERHATFAPSRAAVAAQARRLAAATRRPADILDWELPDGLPGAVLYDGFLNRQRQPEVDIAGHDFTTYLEDALMNLEAARRILDRVEPNLLVVSHPFNFSWGPLVWGALARGIDVLWLFGLYGVNRFVHMTRPEHMNLLYDQVTPDEMASLPADRQARFRTLGQDYLDHRLGGRTDDIQADFAFRRATREIDRQDLAERFGWDPERPVIGVYASNWFDWPHQLGMTHFTDFRDWTRVTAETAAKSEHANWLIKPHPLDAHFGGIALSDVIGDLELPGHVRIADSAWNNRAVMSCLDALVTYHGTAGIEFAAQGGPVLLPDRGKYELCGFALQASSREDYIGLLGQPWWHRLDLDAVRANAQSYAGLFFCAPAWQKPILQGDDNVKDANLARIAGILEHGGAALEQELNLLARWYASGETHFHRYKMLRTDEPDLTNVIAAAA